MSLSSKKILFVNLERETSEVKTFPDLKPFIGGFALSLKLFEVYKDLDPIIFATGPLNGLFPYISKTAVVLRDEELVQDFYLGGHLSTRLRFTGIDALMIYGNPKEKKIICVQNEQVSIKSPPELIDSCVLPGKSSTIRLEKNKILIDGYFGEPENNIARKFHKMNLFGMAVTGTKTVTLDDMKKYEEVYKGILKRTEDLEVEKGFFPSCSGCPMGCEKSKVGEKGGDALLHSLVACGYATKIYSDVGTVFSCLNTLGYDYTHEDIEAIPSLVQQIVRNLKV